MLIEYLPVNLIRRFRRTLAWDYIYIYSDLHTHVCILKFRKMIRNVQFWALLGLRLIFLRCNSIVTHKKYGFLYRAMRIDVWSVDTRNIIKKMSRKGGFYRRVCKTLLINSYQLILTKQTKQNFGIYGILDERYKHVVRMVSQAGSHVRGYKKCMYTLYSGVDGFYYRWKSWSVAAFTTARTNFSDAREKGI